MSDVEIPKTYTRVTTIERLEAEVQNVLLLGDPYVVRVVVATVLANRMPFDPVWLMLVAASSSGKTEIISSLNGLDFIYPISDITANTFMSGAKAQGKETSLLHKMGSGIMAFKDFTSILSKNKETKAEILKQLREIYDGEYVKRTGTGTDLVWKGKVGSIAGATEVVYRHLDEFSAMGDRFIMYSVKQPDRIKAAHRSMQNAASNMVDKRQRLRDAFSDLIRYLINRIPTETIELTEETINHIVIVANFATLVRSSVMTDFKTGLVDFVPAPEMPTRVIAQLYSIAAALIVIRTVASEESLEMVDGKHNLTDNEKKILYKLAFDSIPRTRRDVINPLAVYKAATTSGIATALDLPTESAKKYLSQINALGICRRIKRVGGQGDIWRMKQEYRDLLSVYEGVLQKDEMLRGNEDDSASNDADMLSIGDDWDPYSEAVKNESFDADIF